MVNVPKARNTYCAKCNKHGKFKVQNIFNTSLNLWKRERKEVMRERERFMTEEEAEMWFQLRGGGDGSVVSKDGKEEAEMWYQRITKNLIQLSMN